MPGDVWLDCPASGCAGPRGPLSGAMGAQAPVISLSIFLLSRVVMLVASCLFQAVEEGWDNGQKACDC